MNEYEARNKFVTELATKKIEEIFDAVKKEYKEKGYQWLIIGRVVACIFHFHFQLSVSESNKIEETLKGNDI